MSFVNTLMHHGMVYVGLPYACPELACDELALSFTEAEDKRSYGEAIIEQQIPRLTR